MSLRSPTALMPALGGTSFELWSARTGRIHCYFGEPASPAHSSPAILVHSVNAAASAFEVRPIFEHLRGTRPTYALDLPGFGLSERGPRTYSPGLMTDAILELVREIRTRHGGGGVDALGLSLGCEFLARAASESPGAFRSLALVSPTGLDGRRRTGPPGGTRAVPFLGAALRGGPWGPWLFRQLTRPRVVRYFLERTWGAPTIDEEMLAYDVASAAAPGAADAPLTFLSGALFSADISVLYEALTLPVWVAHGVRGDFVKYDGAATLASRSGWKLDVFQTGALPHFEVPQAFFAAYDAFLGAG